MNCKPLQSWRDFQLECALRAAMLRTMDEKNAARALDRAAVALEPLAQANRPPQTVAPGHNGGGEQ